MALTEQEELEYLRLKKAKFLASQKNDDGVPVAAKANETEPPSGGSTGERFTKGAFEGIGQAGLGISQFALDALTPQTFGREYTDPARNVLKNTVDASRQRVSDLGTAGIVGQIGGNIAGSLPFVASGRAVPNAVQSAGRNILGMATLGAIEGSKQSVGSNDSRLANAAVGGVTSGLVQGTGSAIGGVGNAASSVYGIAKTVAKGKTADEALKDIIDRSGLTPQQILDAIQNGQISGIADVAGDTVQGLTRSVAKTQGGKDVISDALQQRAEGASQRIANDLDANVSYNNKYFQTLDDLKTKRSEQAAPLYKEAYAKNRSVKSNEIDRILETPAGKTALQNAVIRMRNDQSLVGIPDKELNEQAQLVGMKLEGGVATGLNLRTLDYVKRELDSQIGRAYREGDNNLGSILTGLKNKLTSELDQADVTAKAGPRSLKPEGGAYAQARKVSSDSFTLEEAQKAGREFDSANMRPAQLQKMLSEMSDAEREAYKIGVRERAQQTIERASDSTDVAKSIFGNAERRSRLQAILGPKEYSSLEKRMLEERNASKTMQRVLGGSRTDFNIDSDQGWNEMLDAGHKVAREGLIKGGLSAFVDKSTAALLNRFKGITEKNAEAIAKALIGREEGIKALERIYANQINKSSPTARAAQEAIQTINRGGGLKQNISPNNVIRKSNRS